MPVAGVLLAIVSSVTFGLTAVLARVGLSAIGSGVGTFVSMLSSLAVVLAVSLVFDLGSLVSVSGMAVLWFTVAGILQFALGRYLNFIAIHHIGAARATLVVAWYPLVAAVLAVLFLGEKLTPLVGAGILSIVAGVTLLVRER